MAALNDNQSKELCRKIEQLILKNGYFIFDTYDWDGLHVEYKPFTHGKNYEYADYTEITVALDSYNVTDKLQVKYNFIKSVYVGRTGDSYRVYYKRENGEKDGGRPYSMNEAAEFIANRFIELVEDKIMNKKFENYKEYPEVVYKDRVYRWFTNSTRSMSDSELQKFVNLCMRGNLTFQCADEIDIDDPDISMIDHLLMDIASEKNDELINTYTDEIDWDNDYIEKYNRNSNMDRKKLEARVARLEKLVYSKTKNEALKKYLPARYSYDSLEYDINETNSYDINDILAAYARVGHKPKKILKELLASGDIDEWAKECACSTEELYSSIEESMYDYDDTSSITVEGQGSDTAKCKVVLPDKKAFTVYMPVYPESDFDDDMDENLSRNNSTVELSIAVNDELNSRNGEVSNMDKKLEARIARLEKLVSKNEAVDFNIADRVWNVAHQVSEANKAYMELRNDLVKANRESDEYEDIIEELNEAFDGLNDADQVLQRVARQAHRKYR